MHNDVRVTRFKRLLAGSQALAQKKDWREKLKDRIVEFGHFIALPSVSIFAFRLEFHQ